MFMNFICSIYSTFKHAICKFQVGQPAEVEFREVDLGSDRTLTITEGETASVSMMNDNVNRWI